MEGEPFRLNSSLATKDIKEKVRLVHMMRVSRGSAKAKRSRRKISSMSDYSWAPWMNDIK